PPQLRRQTRESVSRRQRHAPGPCPEEPNPEAGPASAEALACLGGPPADAVNDHVHDFFTVPVSANASRAVVGGGGPRADLVAQLREKVFRWFPTERIPFETKVAANDGGWAARYADYEDVERTGEPGVR